MEIDAKTILYISLGVGGIMGGVLTSINKIRFTKKSEFDEHRKTCPVLIGGKVDNVSKTVEDLKSTVETNAVESQKRREADREFLNDHLINIATFIGKVEQYMYNKKL